MTGESGELAVASVWTEAGAAVDFVHRDYGEDLLVQTALAAAGRLAWMGRIHHISRSLAAIDHDQILVLDFEDVGEIHVLPALGTTSPTSWK